MPATPLTKPPRRTCVRCAFLPRPAFRAWLQVRGRPDHAAHRRQPLAVLLGHLDDLRWVIPEALLSSSGHDNRARGDAVAYSSPARGAAAGHQSLGGSSRRHLGRPTNHASGWACLRDHGAAARTAGVGVNGCVSRRVSGEWGYRFDIDPDPMTGNRRRRTKSGFKTRREAATATASYGLFRPAVERTMGAVKPPHRPMCASSPAPGRNRAVDRDVLRAPTCVSARSVNSVLFRPRGGGCIGERSSGPLASTLAAHDDGLVG